MARSVSLHSYGWAIISAVELLYLWEHVCVLLLYWFAVVIGFWGWGGGGTIKLTLSGLMPKASAILVYSSFTLEKSLISFVELPCANWQWKVSSSLLGIMDLGGVRCWGSEGGGGGGGRVGVFPEGVVEAAEDLRRSFLWPPNSGIFPS